MRRRLPALLVFTTAWTAGFAQAQAPGCARVRIGVEGNDPPFSQLSPNGQLAVFDIDIASALCAEMKADCVLACPFGLADVLTLSVARDVDANHLQPVEAFGTAALLHSALTFTLVGTFKAVEGRYGRHLRPQLGPQAAP